jgi:hypothetical protein
VSLDQLACETYTDFVYLQLVHPSVKTEDAKTIFPDIRIVKPYLRFTPLPKEKTTAA